MHDRNPDAIGRVATSVMDRLKASARNRGEDANLMILRYVLERWLHRLSIGPAADQFVVKGGMMMPLLGAGSRPTEDIDGHSHIVMDEAATLALLSMVCSTTPSEEDGIVFDESGTKLQTIRDGIMPGFRAMIPAVIHPAGGRPSRLSVTIDLCFGDRITPEPAFAELPCAVKGFAPVRIAVYPWPTVVAEKLHALARHGVATSRMKDLYDIVLISRKVAMHGADLTSAIGNTFREWGETDPMLALDVISGNFAEIKAAEWLRFLKRKGANTLDMPGLEDVVGEIDTFARGAVLAAARDEMFEMEWVPGEGWGGSVQSLRVA